jgi:hypothetical protein
MGDPVYTDKRPLGCWAAVRPYRERKLWTFILLLVMLGVVSSFLVVEIVSLLVHGYRFIDEEVYFCCYSVMVCLAVVLGLFASGYYRHHLALSVADDPVYRTFRVGHQGVMVDVVDRAVNALDLEHVRVDPPGRAFSEGRSFPRNIQAMFRVRDPDVVIVVHSSTVRKDGGFLSDVILGPVGQDNLSEVSRMVRAIDHGRTKVRPALHVRTA